MSEIRFPKWEQYEVKKNKVKRFEFDSESGMLITHLYDGNVFITYDLTEKDFNKLIESEFPGEIFEKMTQSRQYQTDNYEF